MLWGHARVVQWGRKDGFPGADGSTIQQVYGENAIGIPIYGSQSEEMEIETISVSTAIGSAVNTKTYSIKHPSTFIYSSSGVRDWYTTNTTNQINVLWGDGDIKSVYDPCPAGWRVASYGTWDDFSAATFPISGSAYKVITGRLYNKMAWYPGGGYRDSSLGKYCYVGRNGFYWSATDRGSNAWNMHFNIDLIAQAGTPYRACGVSIRCVQE